jgi:hypothetical protein
MTLWTVDLAHSNAPGSAMSTDEILCRNPRCRTQKMTIVSNISR